MGTTGDIRIISSIKPEGYILGSKEFKLKVVFKYKFIDSVTFHAIDESGKGREILLNGKAELTLHPSVSIYDYSDVVVSVNPVTKGEYTEASPGASQTSKIESMDCIWDCLYLVRF